VTDTREVTKNTLHTTYIRTQH